MVDPCPTATLTLVSNPFVDEIYVLRDPTEFQSWDFSTLVTSSTLVDCGPYDINFFNDDATETTLDPDLFEVNKVTSQIITKYTEDVTKKANYPISYRVSYTNYAATTFVKTATPFTISVQDPCDTPISVTPSVLTN